MAIQEKNEEIENIFNRRFSQIKKEGKMGVAKRFFE
jgi:hypothetical protein